MATSEQWLLRLSKLRVDRASGNPAPHKPLLLLAVLELYEGNQISDERLALTAELSFTFATYWQAVAARRTQRPLVRYPFFHLKSDGLWCPLDAQGKPAASRDDVAFAAVPSDVRACMADPIQREHWRRLLVERYFRPEERISLYELMGMPQPTDAEVSALDSTIAAVESARVGREAQFRLRVVTAYNYTCALTGYRLTTLNVGSIVDAAHIHQFAQSQNNDPTNGVALCKNAHWAFDQGLWTLSDDHRVIVAVSKFAEASPDARPLHSYHNQLLRLPADAACWPSPVHLAWHRKHRFLGA